TEEDARAREGQPTPHRREEAAGLEAEDRERHGEEEGDHYIAAASAHAPALNARRNAGAIRGANCAPAPRSVSASAGRAGSARRYGRVDVIASNASTTASRRAPSGTSVPGRRVG